MTKPIDPGMIHPRSDSGYPEPFRSRVLPRDKRALGDAAGLTRIGVNLTTLYPGAESSMRHWHSAEEEFVYVLEGELVLRTNVGETVLRAGFGVGFRAGVADAHQLVNRSGAPAVYLEFSNRDEADRVVYPDVDLRWNAPDAPGVYSHHDGQPY